MFKVVRSQKKCDKHFLNLGKGAKKNIESMSMLIPKGEGADMDVSGQLCIYTCCVWPAVYIYLMCLASCVYIPDVSGQLCIYT